MNIEKIKSGPFVALIRGVVLNEDRELWLSESDYLDLARHFAEVFKEAPFQLPGNNAYYCGICGDKLTEVRPGKHQCDSAQCSSNRQKL